MVGDKVKRERGRPKVDDPKIPVPSIVIRQSTLDRVAEFVAINNGLSVSALFQAALDMYFSKVDEMEKYRITL